MATKITKPTPPSISPSSPTDQFDLLGWKPDQNLSDDENYMDIVFLITQGSSQEGIQGHMGSLIVRPSGRLENNEADDDEAYKNRIYRGILGAATNLPLFGEKKDCTSDIHAEISALGQACRSCQSTEGCTAYITIPPCKRCFAALVAFGIKRIVTRQMAPPLIRDTAREHGMEVLNFTQEQNRNQMERINRIANKVKSDEELMAIAERNKTQRRQRKLSKRGQATKRI